MNKPQKKSTAPLLLLGNAVGRTDVRYASGFSCPDAVWLLALGRKRILVVSDLEFGRARHAPRVDAVMTPTQLGLSPTEARRLDGWALALLNHYNLKTIRVPAWFPLRSARFLAANAIDLEPMDGPCFPERAIKSTAEIRRITLAQRAAVRAMRAAFDDLRRADIGPRGILRLDGNTLSAERLRRRIQSVLIDHGCLAEEIIVAGGRQAADPHQRGEGPLRSGQTLVLDIFPRETRDGYWGDLTRTVIKGAVSPLQRRLFRAVRDAQRAALDQVRAGVRAAQVDQAARQVLDDRGFPTEVRDGQPVGFIHSTGHGLGLDIHEAPRISAGDERLKSGQVITIEPGWYDPDFGGVRIEDTVCVTKTGHHLLARCPMPMRIP